MKTKQEKIEEMAKANKCNNKQTCKECIKCFSYVHSEDLYSAGYRKASEVIDEFVERLKQKQFNKDLFNDWAGATYVVLVKDVDELAAEMRQEVK